MTRGSTEVGMDRVEELTWIVGVRLEGWVREIAILE